VIAELVTPGAVAAEVDPLPLLLLAVPVLAVVLLQPVAMRPTARAAVRVTAALRMLHLL
jgi:hypothetical protein